MLKNLNAESASRYRRILTWAGNIALLLLFVSAYELLTSEPPSLAFTPMLGPVGGRALGWILALLIAVLIVGGRIAKKGRERAREDFMPLLFLGLGVLFFASLTVFASWERLNIAQDAPRVERTVTISSVSHNDEEPDCRTAYYFTNSAGLESWVCTDDQVQVGTKARVVEHRSVFGVSVLQFKLLPAPSGSTSSDK